MRSNFLYVEGSTARLYDYPHRLLAIYVADQCHDKLPTKYLDTVLYVAPNTFDYATPIPREIIPRNLIAFYPDNDQFDTLTRERIKKTLPNYLNLNSLKLPLAPTHLQLMKLVYTHKKNLNNFGIAF